MTRNGELSLVINLFDAGIYIHKKSYNHHMDQ